MVKWKWGKQQLRETLISILQIFASEDDYIRNGQARRHTKYGVVDRNNNLINDDQAK